MPSTRSETSPSKCAENTAFTKVSCLLHPISSASTRPGSKYQSTHDALSDCEMSVMICAATASNLGSVAAIGRSSFISAE